MTSKEWLRILAVCSILLLASGAYWVTHTTWPSWWIFFGCCAAWSVTFWTLFDLRGQERLAAMDEAMQRSIRGYIEAMKREQEPRELHTEADNIPPLDPLEAESMGRQTETHTLGEKISDQVVYGDVDEGFENEDQADEHHADADDIV